MERYSVHLKLLGMAVLWGASWPMGRILGQSLPPLTGGAVRFVLASVLLLGWLFARSRFATLAALSARQWLGLMAAASVGVCGYAVFFMLGLQTMPAGKAAVVVAVNPVLTLLLAAWFFGERLNAKILAGYAAGGWWCHYGGNARAAVDSVIGRHQGRRVADFRLRGLLGGLYLNRTCGFARDRRADGNGGNVVHRRADVVGGGIVDGRISF